MALVEGFNEAVRGSARGSLLLMMGQIVSTIISALTIIVVARLHFHHTCLAYSS